LTDFSRIAFVSQLSVFAENLLGHIIRLLNILVHVVDDSSAASSSGTKTTLSSFPMGQSLSPIKRHGSTVSSKSVTSTSFDSGLDAKASKGMSPMKTVMNHGMKNSVVTETTSLSVTLSLIFLADLLKGGWFCRTLKMSLKEKEKKPARKG